MKINTKDHLSLISNNKLIEDNSFTQNAMMYNFIANALRVLYEDDPQAYYAQSLAQLFNDNLTNDEVNCKLDLLYKHVDIA